MNNRKSSDSKDVKGSSSGDAETKTSRTSGGEVASKSKKQSQLSSVDMLLQGSGSGAVQQHQRASDDGDSDALGARTDFIVASASNVAEVAAAPGNVCVWDSLMPPGHQLVATLSGNDAGAVTLAYAAASSILVVGGKRGELSAWCLARRERIGDVPRAHTQSVTALAIDPHERFVVSGSSDASVRVWLLPDLQRVDGAQWENAHEKKSFMSKSVVAGVTDIRVNDRHIVSAGADCKIIRRDYKTY